jgi:hypothetical protein
VPAYENCPTCAERGVAVPIEGGVVYSFPCTAEIVILHSGKEIVTKACPDFGRTARSAVLGNRSDTKPRGPGS